ncbi:histidine phosphatase family protein [Nocardia sp. NPDC059691]|uniref:histidine phosphatase family protein n=1 Tax=Nocardia sp. NPDC059691 TaxID=3346908 RepID=UPI0036BEC509
MNPVWLVRHGWTDWEAVSDRGWRGAMLDLAPLSAMGVHRMRGTARRLAAHDVTEVLSSPLTRAMHSAHLLAEQLGVPMTVAPQLHEWSCRTDGAPWDRTAFHAALNALLLGDPPETAESAEAVRLRACQAIESCSPSARVAIVTHSVVIYLLTGVDLPPGGIVPWDGAPISQERRVLSKRPDLRTTQPVQFEIDTEIDVVTVDAELTAMVSRIAEMHERIAPVGTEYHTIRQHHGEIACAIVGNKEDLLRAAAAPLDPFGWPPLRAVLLPGNPSRLCVTVLGRVRRAFDADAVFGAHGTEPWIGQRSEI